MTLSMALAAGVFIWACAYLRAFLSGSGTGRK